MNTLDPKTAFLALSILVIAIAMRVLFAIWLRFNSELRFSKIPKCGQPPDLVRYISASLLVISACAGFVVVMYCLICNPVSATKIQVGQSQLPPK